LDIWETIRIRCVRDREPIKRVARELGISKNTVRKYVLAAGPPSMAKPIGRAAAMTCHTALVDSLLRETPKITATRIRQYIRQTIDADFTVSERSAREFVAVRRKLLIPSEAFVRLVYEAGDQVQFDFKDVAARIAGKEVGLKLFVARLSYSTAFFARCYFGEDRPALMDGLLSSCVHFGGVPREGVFDNASTAVKRVLRGRDREVAAEYAALSGSLAMRMEFASPAKGNEKGGVEGLHGWIDDTFFRPMPEFGNLDDLNAGLEALATSHLDRKVSEESVRARFERERIALRALPSVLPATCVREAVRINKFAEARHKTNRYSVPSRFAHRDAILEVFHDCVRIVVDTVDVAEHKRSYGRNDAVLDPLHFVDLLSFKHRAVVRAEVFRQRSFDAALRKLLDGYVEHHPLDAGKRFMRVMRLLEHCSMDELINAVIVTRQRGTDDPAAIALAVEQKQHPYLEVPALQLPAGSRGLTAPSVNLDAYDVQMLLEATI